MDVHLFVKYEVHRSKAVLSPSLIIIIMIIFKCYFYRELIAFFMNNKNGVKMELGKTNRLKALCMMHHNA